MSLFGGARYTAIKYTGLQLQTSTSTACIPFGRGVNRGAPNLIYYTDFKAKANRVKGKGGGKITASYDYSATIILALCYGVLQGIGTTWKDQSTIEHFSDTHFTLFYGTTPQAAWSYLLSHHPTEALSYAGVAYVAYANFPMGQSPTLPSATFELYMPRKGSQVGGDGKDADCALTISDFLTDVVEGVGLPSSILDNLLSTGAATTTGDSAYQTYCRAIGFGMSPLLTSQEQALTILDRWTMITNTACFWSGYSLKFIPYGDETITANGVTYLPPTTVIYNLADTDYKKIDNEDPIKASRTDTADAYNAVRVTINDRSNNYTATPVALQNQDQVEKFGVRQAQDVQATEICVTAMAAIMVQLMTQRYCYIRNQYNFSLDWRFCLLEPMDVVTLTDLNMGLNLTPVRIISIEEDDQGILKVVAEQLLLGVSSAGGFTPQQITNNPQNQESPPGPVNPPVIFEPQSVLTQGVPEVWIGASGGDGTTYGPMWGGCQVWISTDNTTFNQIGEIEEPALQGKLTANFASYGGSPPDATNTLAITTLMSNAEIVGGTAAEAANNMLLSYCDGELLSFETATLTGTDTYNLQTIYRGLYGTTAGSHLSGTQFLRLDSTIFKYQLPTQYRGIPLWFKFVSFNIWRNQLEDIATVTSYPFTPNGTGFGGGTLGVPLRPTGLTASGGIQQATTSWAANTPADNVTAYKLYRANGTGALFGSASVVWVGLSLLHIDSPLAPSSGYTYFLTAVNAAGESLPTAGVNATTSSIALLQQIYLPSVFSPGLMDVLQLMLIHTCAESVTLPANMGSSQFGATAVASGSVVINVDQALAASPNIWTTIGTITVAAGTITATFATVGGTAYTFAAGDRVRVIGPAVADTNLANPNISLLMTRN